MCWGHTFGAVSNVTSVQSIVASPSVVAAGNTSLVETQNAKVADALKSVPQSIEDYLVQYADIQEFSKLSQDKQYPYLAQRLIRTYTDRANLAFANGESVSGEMLLAELQNELARVKSIIQQAD